jgi:ATP-dependent Clp protease protease subunit
MSNIKTDELSQFHSFNVYTPARLIYLEGDIDKDTAGEFIRNIRLMDHVTDKDITVMINSDGGSVRAGMDIIDAIRECSSKVITHNIGSCYSMAAIIFQAGDFRLMSENASLMIHIGDEGYENDHPKNIDTWIKENRRLGEKADVILFERIKKKKPRFTKEKFKELLVFDTIYTSDRTIEMGLADKIAEHKEF